MNLVTLKKNVHVTRPLLCASFTCSAEILAGGALAAKAIKVLVLPAKNRLQISGNFNTGAVSTSIYGLVTN